ncbi:lipopolysaccharide biosynthesis protein [Methylobacter psychrophilus]|uniref:lipopolysaccharide biosynthesis protein n=1 Tax=Methylobacter psychrophilus TaxID=96941 RepID=UPI0021D4FFF5|nr:oligosaccharide flippase family protein [Methylobacter psychrophilus]
MIQLLLSLSKNKELMLVGFGQFFSVLSSFIFLKLVSHYASVAEYGLYALALTIAGFIGLFPFTVFDQAVSRYIPVYQSENQYAKNYTNILLIYIGLIVIYLLFIISIKDFIQTAIPRDILTIFWALILYTIFNTIRITLLNIENSTRNRHVFAGSRIFEGIARIILLLLIIHYYAHPKAADLLYLTAIVFILNIIYLLYRNRLELTLTGISLSTTKKNLACYIKFSTPLLIWSGFGWCQSFLPVWFLKFYSADTSTYLVGHFAMLNTIGALIPAQVVGVISMYIAPIIYQKEPEQPGYAKVIINQVIRYLGLAFLLALVMLFLFHDRIMLLLTSAQYVSSSWLLPYAFLGAVFLGIGQLWTLELFAYHQTKKLLVANIAPSLITLLLSYLLIPQWNIIGAVISLSFAGFVYMGLVFIAKTRFAMRRNNNFL